MATWKQVLVWLLCNLSNKFSTVCSVYFDVQVGLDNNMLPFKTFCIYSSGL